MEWVMIAAGLLLLVLAGDLLVKGAVNLALRLGIPALIVGLTVVAFGTSAPELLVSVDAVLKDAPGLALGNVIGSNIANILLVLGLPALVAGLHSSHCDARKSYITMMLATLLFIGLSFAGQFTAFSGLVLLAALAVILTAQYRDARTHRAENRAAMAARAATLAENGEDPAEDLEGVDPSLPLWRILVYLALGLAGLPLGADLLVDGAVVVAETFGMSDTVIGLTLVALGTSLPELATTLAAALRRNADVAMGNVLGSNMFNLLAIIGIASHFGTIPVDPAILRVDLWIMLASSVLLLPFVYLRRDMGRSVGLVLCALYVVYIVYLLN